MQNIGSQGHPSPSAPDYWFPDSRSTGGLIKERWENPSSTNVHNKSSLRSVQRWHRSPDVGLLSSFIQVFVWPKRSHVGRAALRKDGGTGSMRTSRDSQGVTSGLQTLGCERSHRLVLLRKRARLHHSSDTLSTLTSAASYSS